MKRLNILLWCAIAITMCVIAVGVVNAQAPPSLPCFIEGEVKINDAPAPLGTVVTAEIEGDVKDTCTLRESGEPYSLTVDGPNSGKEIKIYVNGVLSGKSVEWKSGGIYNIDLTVFTDKEDSDPGSSPAAGSGSGSGASPMQTPTAKDEPPEPEMPGPGVPSTFPDSFYGSVEINGKPAPAGTVVRAYIEGKEYGNITVIKEGEYADGLNRYLEIRGTDEEIGKQIKFTVNGVQANETAIYDPGDINKLNLTASIPEAGKGDEEGEVLPGVDFRYPYIIVAVLAVIAVAAAIYMIKKKR